MDGSLKSEANLSVCLHDVQQEQAGNIENGFFIHQKLKHIGCKYGQC